METTQTKWTIDTHHSKLQFKVKHLAIANVAGTFKIFSGEVQSNTDDFNGAQITVEIDANSISTDHEERDGHLKSPLFLDTAKFPKITFTGTLNKQGSGYVLNGGLTIKDVTKNVQLETEFNGLEKDNRFKNTRAGFEATGKINRKDFGVSFHMLTEAGGLAIGEEVKLHFDIELIRLPVNLVPVA